MKQLNTLNAKCPLPKGLEFMLIGQSKFFYFKGFPSLLLIYAPNAETEVRVFDNPTYLQEWLNEFMLSHAQPARQVKKGDVYSLFLGDDVAYCVVDHVINSSKVIVRYLNRWRNYTDMHEFMCFPIVGSYLDSDEQIGQLNPLNGDLLQLENMQAGCFFEYMEPLYVDDKDFKELRVYMPKKYKVSMDYLQF